MLKAVSLIPAEFLTRERIKAWATVFLCLEAACTLFLIFFKWGYIMPLHKPGTTDFASFYSAGTLAAGPHPEDAYDQSQLYAREQQIRESGIQRIWFFYPPIFLLLCRMIAIFPYFVAYYLCLAIGAALYLTAMVRLWPEREDRAIVLLLATAFPPVFFCAGIGQNTLLTAALFGFGAALFRSGRPFAAGAVLGLLCYKPHFGMLLPVAFLAARQWKAIAGAAFSVIALALLSVAIFGWDVWRAYFHVIPLSTAIFRDGVVPHSKLASVYALALALGASDSAAWWAQGMIALLMAAVIFRLWNKSTSWDQRFAALIPATELSMPVILFYDLAALAISGLLAIRAARDAGNAQTIHWQKTAGIMVFIGFPFFFLLVIRQNIPPFILLPIIFLLSALKCDSTVKNRRAVKT